MVEYRSPCIFRNKSEFPDLVQQNLNTLEEFHLMEDTLKESKQGHIGTNDDLLIGTYVTALASKCLYFIIRVADASATPLKNHTGTLKKKGLKSF